MPLPATAFDNTYNYELLALAEAQEDLQLWLYISVGEIEPRISTSFIPAELASLVVHYHLNWCLNGSRNPPPPPILTENMQNTF
jgi:hypothetical protein